jgi:hypothetical protein
MYTASVISSSNQIMVIGPSGFRNYVSCDAKPQSAVIQGDEVHVVLENGWINVYNFRTSARLRTITG